MNFLRFLISKTFWINLLLMMLISAILVFATLTFLKIYTQHGISENVPDLRGMTVNEVKEKLKFNEFRFTVNDSTYVNGKKPYEVIAQDPVAGSAVKRNRNVYLTVNAATPPETRLPDILDSSLKNAREQLTSRGLLLGNIEEEPGLGRVVKKMKVNGEEKLPGEGIYKGTMVDLVITDGLGTREIVVPYVIGQTFSEAKAQLRMNQLDVGAVVKDDDVQDLDNAYVYEQKPAAISGNLIRIGGTVDLFLQTEEIFDDQVDYLDEEDYYYYNPDTGEYESIKANKGGQRPNSSQNPSQATPQGTNDNSPTFFDQQENSSDQNINKERQRPRDLFKRKP